MIQKTYLQDRNRLINLEKELVVARGKGQVWDLVHAAGFKMDNQGLPGAQWYRIRLHCRRSRFNPWVGKIPWRRALPPTPVFLPGESDGQRSLVGYSP